MPYTPNELPTTVGTLGAAFIVGVLAQYLRQRTDVTMSNFNIMWLSIAAGFSSAVVIGLLYEYTAISPAFLFAISGIAGWAGVALMGKLAKAMDLFITDFIEKRLKINMADKEKEVKTDDRTTTSTDPAPKRDS
jgi:hypothetical protein